MSRELLALIQKQQAIMVRFIVKTMGVDQFNKQALETCHTAAEEFGCLDTWQIRYAHRPKHSPISPVLILIEIMQDEIKSVLQDVAKCLPTPSIPPQT